jgi:predicted acyltransferase
MSTRIQSIDIFRGLTILTMVFVNDLAGVRDIPAWTKHALEGTDSMTFVDVVFPAFLFIVGMSIPLALQRRKDRGASSLTLWGHVLTRSFALLVLGFFMVNMSRLNPALTGMSRPAWAMLFYLAVLALWTQSGATEGKRRRVFWATKTFGLLLIVLLAALFRSGDASSPGWMTTQWWGILGLIGWTYLVCSGFFLVFGENIPAAVALVSIAVSLYLGDRSGVLRCLGPVNNVIWLGGHVGGHVSIAGAGMIAGLLFMPGSPAPTSRLRIRWLLGMGVALAAGGFLLRPLFGISKNMATPSWSLYSTAICCAVYVLLYWIADLRQHGRLFAFSEPAGANPLLAYILPDIFYSTIAIFGVEQLWWGLGYGFVGVLRSLLFSAAIVGITAYLTKLGLRLKL